MKKTIIIGIIILVAVAAGLLLLRGNEDTWLCQNGQWVKHGNPSAPQPTSGCGNEGQNPNPQPAQEADAVPASPQPNQTITSPLVLSGKARGSWFFEASAPVKILDDKGNTVASGHIQAQGDWMTQDYVQFTGQIAYSYNATTSGTVVFDNDNPSGSPQTAKEYKVPVQLVPTQSTQVNVYFNNDNLDPQKTCNKVFAAQRYVPKTETVAQTAMNELLNGPSDQEKNNGYYTNIPAGVQLQKLTIENGVAKVDFDQALQQGVAGSCKVAAIRAQITQTLMQFSNIKSVVISINGNSETILQP